MAINILCCGKFEPTLTEVALQKIAIVGGGIGGLATALSIPRSRFEIEIFEQAAVIKGSGSGLTLWPNATYVLRDLNLLDECLARSGCLETLRIRLANDKPIMSVPTGSYDTPAIAIHRRDLHSIMLAHVTVPIYLNRRCLGVRTAVEGSYLQFAEDESGPYDLIVAADGMNSLLRNHVVGPIRARHKGYTIWRGVADASDQFADDGNFFEIWARSLRFGVLPLGHGMVCWYAARNQVPGDRRSAGEQKASLLKDFETWHFPAHKIMSRTAAETILPSDVTDLKPTRGWNRDRVLLLGDAIHPMPANLGLGGNMALEDAMTLGKLLSRSGDLQQVMIDFEKLRFARVTSITRDSNFVGYFCQTSNPVINLLRNGICSVVPGRLFTWDAQGIYAHQADRVGE